MSIKSIFRLTALFHLFNYYFFAPNPAFAQLSLPGNFQDITVSTGWPTIEGFRFDATGQMYVWQKNGMVWVVDTNGIKISTPLLNIYDEVGNWRDHGLNGFVLDPNFRTNGYYYLFYTVDRHHLLYSGTPTYHPDTNKYFAATIVRVTRCTADASTNFTTTLPGSRLVLIGETIKTGIPLLHESHSGGQLSFGTDGSLLVSTGDGASYNVADEGTNGDTYWQQALNDSIIRPKENVGSFRSQLVDCLNGKVLRIDPLTGNGLPSNPFYDPANPRAPKSRVWALGLRNPFRMTVRPGSGHSDPSAGDPGVIYLGDVGWGSWEDIHIVKSSGFNLGWPLFEGMTSQTSYQAKNTLNLDAPNPLFGTGGCTQQFFRFKDLLIQETLAPPVWKNPCDTSVTIPNTVYRFMHLRPDIDYAHNPPQSRTKIFNGTTAATINLSNSASPVPGPNFNGFTSVGGVWYTGTKFPIRYQNCYFHADYALGWMRKFNYNLNNNPDSVVDFGSGLGSVVFIEYNPKDQWLYYAKYPSEIHRIRYNGAINNPPTAVAVQNLIFGASPLTVQFTGSNSTDPENQPLTYQWSFGDGGNSSQADPSHTYVAPSSLPVTYKVYLTVTDAGGLTSKDSLSVFVNNTPPQVAITSFSDGDLYSMSQNTTLPLQASVTDAEHSPSQLFYSWKVFLHHNNHEHQEAADTNRNTSAVLTPNGCNGDTYYYRVELTVTDAGGLATSVSSNLFPACDPPEADFASDITLVCKNGSVQFTDYSSNLPDTWQWLFPGGTPSSSTLQNPLIFYNRHYTD